MRLFAAIPLPDPVRRALAGVAGGLPGPRWAPEENYHVTLAFLGELDRAEAEEAAGALEAVRAEPFRIAVSGLGDFGRRHLHARLEPEALRELHLKVAGALGRAGFAVEARKYRPHVTLARSRPLPDAALARWMAEREPLRTEAWTVDGFSLFSSRLGTGHPVYREEVRFPFPGPAFRP